MILFTRNLFTAEIQNYLPTYEVCQRAINHTEWKGKAAKIARKGLLWKQRIIHHESIIDFYGDPSWIFNEKIGVVIIPYTRAKGLLCALKMIELLPKNYLLKWHPYWARIRKFIVWPPLWSLIGDYSSIRIFFLKIFLYYTDVFIHNT